MPDANLPVHPEQSARLGSFAGVRVREDVAFTNHKGDEKGGIRKRAEKTIEKLQEALRKVLEPEEAVFYLGRAQLPVSPLEELFLGWLAYYTDIGVLVLTNRRLLFFLVTRNGAWKKSVRSVGWGDIQEARVKGWLGKSLRVRYRDGKQESYWRLRGSDGRKIKGLIAVLIEAGQSDVFAAKGMVHLCPACVAPLASAAYKCANCGANFKTERNMARRAWLIPGGGYFYAGHAGLAALDFLIEAILLFEIVVYALVALGLTQLEVDPGEQRVSGGAAWVVVGYFAAIWVVKKLLTIRHCRRFIREFIPAA